MGCGSRWRRVDLSDGATSLERRRADVGARSPAARAGGAVGVGDGGAGGAASRFGERNVGIYMGACDQNMSPGVGAG